MIGFNEPLCQLVLLSHQVFDYLPELLTALILVALHLPQASLVLTQNHAQFLIAPSRLHIRHYRVLDHLRVLPESQSAKGLLKLGGTRGDTEDDGGARVAPEGGPENLGEGRVSVGDVRVRGAFLRFSFKGDNLGKEEQGLVDVLAFLDSH